MLSHYDGAVAEAQLLHSREEGCAQRSADALFFSIFRKTGGRPSQRSYRMPHLEQVVMATGGQDDVYLSQSSFFSFGRQAVNFKQTRAAWVDLDIYNLGRTLDSAAISQIIAHGEQLGIPAPTAVISSGRGCYLKWVFETPVNQAQLPTWNLLQSTLTAAYASLAADFKSRDVARVFRLLDTRNSKSGELVRRIDGSGKLYDFAAFCKSVEGLRVDLLVETTKARISNLTRKTTALAESLGQGVERGNAEALALYSELNQPIMLEAMSARSLNWMRFCDLRDLYKARGGIPVGERDQAMFWMLNFLSHAEVIRAQNWDAEIAELLKAFPSQTTFDPLNDGSMKTLLNRLKDKEAGRKYSWRGVEVEPLYRPTNDHLIETFGIKLEEMGSLSTLISPLEKRNRADAKVDCRHERREERIRWRLEVKEAFQACADQAGADSDTKPINISALAKFVGVERTRVSRYWAELNRTGGEATKVPAPMRPPKLKLNKPECPPALSLGEALDRLDQSKRANEKAHEAQAAASAMALERKMSDLREAWARRKILNLVGAGESESRSTGEAEMATEILTKRMAQYQAAIGDTPPIGAAAAQESPPASIAPATDPGGTTTALPAQLGDAMAKEAGDDVPAWFDAPMEMDGAHSPVAPLQVQQATVPTKEAPPFAPVVASSPATSVMSPRERLAQATRKPTTEQSQNAARRDARSTDAAKPAAEGERGRALTTNGPAAPSGYPSKAAWSSDLVPPGSRYSAEEWDAQRIDESGNVYSVVEVHTKSSSWLVQLLQPKVGVSNQVIDGRAVEVRTREYPADFKDPALCDLLAQQFDSCIWLSERAPAEFPGAAEGRVEFGGSRYSVIRSRADYLDPDRYYKVGTKFAYPFDMAGLIAQMGPVQADVVTPQDELPSPPAP